MSTTDVEQRFAAEQRARVLIDSQLNAAGRAVQHKKGLNLFAAQGVAVRAGRAGTARRRMARLAGQGR